MRSAIKNYLRADGAAAGVMAHGALLLRLNGMLAQALPSVLQGAVRVANIKSGKVILMAENGSVAVKLRQMATRLQTAFRAAGVECNGVDVKVQPSEILSESMSSSTKPLSATSCQHLQTLSDSLPEGSDLRGALEKLLSRVARE
ncbi:MAG: hypothetical protein RIR18_1833 [Pseudomonadota bacterium]|jgi:hypothetical protein